MARFFHQQNNFLAGQLSPRLYGRTDIEEYRRAVAKMENFRILPTGGIVKRSGLVRTRTILETEDPDFTIYFPYYVNGFFRPLRLYYNISAPSFTAFESGGDVTDYTTGGVILASLRTAASLNRYGFNFTQVGAYLVITHNSGTFAPVVVAPRLLSLSSSVNSFFMFQIGGQNPTLFTSSDPIGNPTDNPWNLPGVTHVPFDNPSTSGITLAVSGITVATTVTLTASSAIFTGSEIGEPWILDSKNASPEFLTGVITATTGTSATPSTTASLFITSVSSGFTGGATDYWYEPAWSKRKGYPRCVTSFENRLIFGSTAAEPNKIWASRSGLQSQMNAYIQGVNNFNITYTRDLSASPNPSLPYSFGLSLGSDDLICWIESNQQLFVGTKTRELMLTGGDSAISAINFPQVKTLSYYGSADVRPAVVKDSIMFIGNTAKTVLTIKFSKENGSYISQRVSDISDILMDSNQLIRKLIYLSDTNTAYFLTSNAKIYSITLSEFENTVGFSSIILNPVINPHDILAVPSGTTASTNFQRLLVAFTYNGNFTREFIGQSAPEFDGNPTLVQQTRFLDDAITVTNSTIANQIGGGSANLQPFVTYVIIDPDGEVDELSANGSGEIILSKPYPLNSVFIVGLKYTARLETLPLEVGPNFVYSSRGDQFRIDNAHLQLYKTFDLNYGSISDGEEILYPLEITTPPAFTGNINVNIPMTSSNDTRIVVESDSPFNVCILGLVLRGTNTQVR